MKDPIKEELNKLCKRFNIKAGLLFYYKIYKDGDKGIGAVLNDSDPEEIDTQLWKIYFKEKGEQFVADIAREHPKGEIFIK